MKLFQQRAVTSLKFKKLNVRLSLGLDNAAIDAYFHYTELLLIYVTGSNYFK